MKEIIKTSVDFKIIPNNFKSSGGFEILEVDEKTIKGKIITIDKRDFEDYSTGSNVEVFGVNKLGLVYFETKINSRVDDILTIDLTQDYSIIQRREYSRVGLNEGKFVFNDMPEEIVLNVQDISAGGIKFISQTSLEIDKHYSVQITLSNNMHIECDIQPIRIQEIEWNSKKAYTISAKFVNLENVDRIVLVQYAFKIKMEEQNKEDN